MNSMKCPICSTEMQWMGDVTILIKDTDKYYHKLSKKAFRSKDIELWGTNWSDGDLFCPNYLNCGNHPGKNKTKLIKDNVERPKAMWILQSHSIDGFFYTCSACNRMIRVSNDLNDHESLSDYPYCHCGAEMINCDSD